MAKKRTSKQQTVLQKPIGYLVSAVLIYGVGWLLFLQALDSGSLLQWFGVLVAVVFGTIRLVQAVLLPMRKFLKK